MTCPSPQNGFTLLELVITLTVSAIMMVALMPLIRLTSLQGVEMQLALRDSCELQSVIERLASTSAQTNLATFKTMVGSGAQDNAFGSYYVHESKYIYFDASRNEAISTNGVSSGLLKLRIGLDSTGPSLVRIFNE